MSTLYIEEPHVIFFAISNYNSMAHIHIIFEIPQSCRGCQNFKPLIEYDKHTGKQIHQMWSDPQQFNCIHGAHHHVSNQVRHSHKFSLDQQALQSCNSCTKQVDRYSPQQMLCVLLSFDIKISNTEEKLLNKHIWQIFE